MAEQTKQQPQPQSKPEPPPVATDTPLQINDVVMGVNAQLTKEQKNG